MTKPSPAKIDHVSYMVQPGMLRHAQTFFYDIFGWELIPNRTVFSDERNTVFLNTGSPITLQLNDLLNGFPSFPSIEGEHLAIAVVNAEDTMNAILAYFGDSPNMPIVMTVYCKKANAEGTKWFIEIDELLAFSLELVTADS